MADDNSELFTQVLTRSEIAVVEALSAFARDALHLGYRDEAVDGMARAIVLLNYMEDHGRIEDSSLPVMKVADKLREDGIYDDVFARARELTEAR